MTLRIDNYIFFNYWSTECGLVSNAGGPTVQGINMRIDKYRVKHDACRVKMDFGDSEYVQLFQNGRL